jgi:hypothetical protein
MEISDYNEIPLCKILYFVRGMGLLAELSRWGHTIDQKMVAVNGSPCALTPFVLIPIVNIQPQELLTLVTKME